MRVRTRPLWLQIYFDVPDKKISRERIIKTLLQSIDNGTYRYPKGWRVAIQWRNKELQEMKTSEFTSAMKDSAESSPGFDIAVYNYLERQL